MSITFTPYAPDAITADGSASLPQLRSYGTTQGAFFGRGVLPSLRQATYVGSLRPQTLPTLRARGSTTAVGGGAGFAKLPAFVAFGDASSTIPQITLGYGAMPSLKAFGTAHFEMQSDGSTTLPRLRARAFIDPSVDVPIFGFGSLPALQGTGHFDDLSTVGWISILQSPGIAYMQGDTTTLSLLTETLQMSGSLNAAWIQTLQDRLRITSTPTALLDALASVGETLSFKDMVGIAYAMLVQESVAIGGTPTGTLRHALQLADALSLVSGAGSTFNAQVTVATAFAMADSLASVYPNALAENVDLSGAAAATLRATLKLLDAMRVQDGVTPGVTWVVQTDEAFELNDANATTATLGMLLAEGIEMLGELRFEDGAYLAWVVNAETRAFVKYRNFPFNSFARIGNRYFGCAGDGIYELAGDDDNGEPIEAVVRGGLSDMGSSLLKNMPAVYIGYSGADQMVLKVTVMTAQKNGDLTREEHWYRMEPRQANALRENRVKLGRGLKSTYWGWELTNINGADFEVDTFSWYPVVLERRLN